MGLQAEASQNLALAQSVYEEVVSRHPDGLWGRRAQTRLDLISGSGPLGERVEWSTHRLVDQVTDVGVLAGLGIGSYGFHWARGSLLRFLGTESFRARALANIGGFVTEVPSMVLATRTIHHFIPPAGGATGLSLSQEMGHMALTLLALRTAGGLTHRALGPWRNSSFGSTALPQLAMFNGILAMRSLEIQLGWAETQNADAFLVDSLAILIQFNAMARMLPLPKSSLGQPRSHRRIQGPEFLQVPQFAGASSMVASPRISVFDGMLLAMSQRPTSSAPPPRLTEVSSPAHRPTRSGVQLRGDRAEYGPVFKSLSLLDQELHDFYGKGVLHRGDWRNHSLSALHRTQECLLWLDDVYQVQNPGKGSMPHLQQLIREIGESHRLLSRYTPDSSTSYLTGQRAELVEAFLRHQYEVPNKTINFFNGDATLPDVIQSARLSRLALQDFMETYTLPQGPVFQGALNVEMVSQAKNIAQDFFRAYAFFPRRPWYGGTVEATQNFSKFLVQVRQRYANAGKPLVYLEETLGTQSEVELALQKLTRSGETPQSLIEGPQLKILMDQLYRAPMDYAEFLKTGRLSHLRNSRHRMSLAKDILHPSND